jgi:hypothetical protein
MPRVINVLPVHYAIIIGPSCFSVTKVSFVAFRFVAIVQVKVCLCCVVVVFLFNKHKVSLILISFLTIS